MVTEEDIRAKAIEVIASDFIDGGVPTIVARRVAEESVTALVDAGLLPVAEVRRPKTTEVSSRAEIRHLTVGIERAFITEWQEVQ